MQQKILLCTFSACAGVCATGCGEAILRGRAASERRRGTRTKRFYALKRADKISSAVPADVRSPLQYPNGRSSMHSRRAVRFDAVPCGKT